ncbi:hypothetical protein VSQ32_12710 [Lachnospiraceae bacterium KK002]
MNKMIRSLYAATVQELTAADRISQSVKEEILNLLKEEEVTLKRQEYERYRDKAFQAASVVEESGFERGFLCAFQLFAECIRQ